MNTKKKCLCVMSCAATLISMSVMAASDVMPDEMPNEIIVTGTYSPITNQQLTASVTSVSHDELLKLSSRSVIDALRQIPGIWVEEQGGAGGLSAINLRGAESNHTLVLVDGIEMNDPTNSRGGSFDLNSINIDSIERVEIIRGAQSSIYGSDALAGVVHIITVDPTEKMQHQFSLAAGENSYNRAGFSTTGTANHLAYAFRLQSNDGGEAVKGSTAKANEFTTKIHWKKDANAVDFSYRYFTDEKTSYPEQSGGSLYAQSDALDHDNFTDQSSALTWQLKINNYWQSKASVGVFDRTEDMRSPGIIPFSMVPPNAAGTDFKRQIFSWVNTLGNEKSLWSNVGLETRKEIGKSQGYVDMGGKIPVEFDLERSTHSGFINLNAFVTTQLLLQASVRHDVTENDLRQNSSSLGMRYTINENTSWFANTGNGYKLPSFFSLGHPLVGNADLKPERVTTAETGIEFSFRQMDINLTLFKSDYRDLIDFDSTTFKNVNRSRVKTTGLETGFIWHSMNNVWQAGIHSGYVDIEAEHPLMNRPKLSAGFNGSYRPNDVWHCNLNYSWVDQRRATSLYTGSTIEEVLDSYNRFDVSVIWQIEKHVQLNVSLENLLNEQYMNDVGFPAPDRAGFVGMTIDF